MQCHPSPLEFLSTPSARRATTFWLLHIPSNFISIHALREEGDFHEAFEADSILISIHALREEGDQCSQSNRLGTKKFLSTPSARRATPTGWYDWQNSTNFYPRPPRGGRHNCVMGYITIFTISIHALREEGDVLPLSLVP